MKKKFFLFTGMFVILASVFFACKHELPFSIDNPSEVPGNTGRNCSPDSVYFANDIQPLLNSSCAMAGCHDVVSHKEDVVLNNYTNTMRIVTPGNASRSKLYKEMLKTGSDQMPPLPMPAMTAAQLAKVEKWINQGAKNNACDKCDTTDFKYSTAIKPLMDTKCVGCHNPSNLGGNIDLSTYNAVKVVALNGKLYGSVAWTAGISAMPKGGVKMPACEIVQIQKWIAAGTPNN